MRLSTTAAAALLALAAAAVPAASATGTAVGGATVTLKDIAFHRPSVHIRRGQRVTWVWKDGAYTAHNLHSVGTPRFPGATARKSGTYSVRFTKAGVYRYECTLHPGMKGSVTVR